MLREALVSSVKSFRLLVDSDCVCVHLDGNFRNRVQMFLPGGRVRVTGDSFPAPNNYIRQVSI